MTVIRTFRNGDLPGLLSVWLQHWSSLGPPPQVNRARLEQAILARTFFSPAGLLVAHQDSQLVGWCHFLPDPDSPDTATICALCFSPQCDEATADALVQQALQRMAAAGLHLARAGVVRDDHFGYAGLEPTGHGIGITAADRRVIAALQRSGFVLHRDVARMIASTVNYRPPVSREGLQLRRSATLQSVGWIPDQPRPAAGMSHIDIERHDLVQRSGLTMASVDLWLSDPEAEVMRPTMAILDLDLVSQRGELTSQESYLVAAVLQSLQQRRIHEVETAIDSVQSVLISQLEQLQFRRVEQGSQWQVTIEPPGN